MAKTELKGPVCAQIFFCDSALHDTEFKKLSLIGLFNIIYAHSIPCNHPRMHVIFNLSNFEDKPSIEVKISDPDGKEIARLGGVVDINKEIKGMNLNYTFLGLPIEKEGNHLVEVIVNGNVIAARELQVMDMSKKKAL